MILFDSEPWKHRADIDHLNWPIFIAQKTNQMTFLTTVLNQLTFTFQICINYQLESYWSYRFTVVKTISVNNLGKTFISKCGLGVRSNVEETYSSALLSHHHDGMDGRKSYVKHSGGQD